MKKTVIHFDNNMPYATYLHQLRRIYDSLDVAVIHISIGQLGKMRQLWNN